MSDLVVLEQPTPCPILGVALSISLDLSVRAGHSDILLYISMKKIMSNSIRIN